MIRDFSKQELETLSEAVDLYEQLITALGKSEMSPRDNRFHIDSEVCPGYAGWIGYNEDGCVVFQPTDAEHGD